MINVRLRFAGAEQHVAQRSELAARPVEAGRSFDVGLTLWPQLLEEMIEALEDGIDVLGCGPPLLAEAALGLQRATDESQLVAQQAPVGEDHRSVVACERVERPLEIEQIVAVDRFEVEPGQPDDEIAWDPELIDLGQSRERDPFELRRREDRRDRLLQLDDVDQVGRFRRSRLLGADALHGEDRDRDQRHDHEREQAHDQRRAPSGACDARVSHVTLSAPGAATLIAGVISMKVAPVVTEASAPATTTG